jgi:hypothetical protein
MFLALNANNNPGHKALAKAEKQWSKNDNNVVNV